MGAHPPLHHKAPNSVCGFQAVQQVLSATAAVLSAPCVLPCLSFCIVSYGSCTVATLLKLSIPLRDCCSLVFPLCCSWDRQPFGWRKLSDGSLDMTPLSPIEITRNFFFANYGAGQSVDNDDGVCAHSAYCAFSAFWWQNW